MALFGKKKKDEDVRSTSEVIIEESRKALEEENEPAQPEEKKGFFKKLASGLAKTRDGLIGAIFGAHHLIDDDFYDELEEAMILADMGMEPADRLISELKKRTKEEKIGSTDAAKECLISIMADEMRPETEFNDKDKAVFLVVGVNGVGKTTSIGKLANYYKQDGKRVMMAAADTFRAAAAEQLTEWSNRAGVPIVKHAEGADPSAVVFDAISSYKARNCDILICDTAGRLHNKKNLMDELSKMRRVIDRELPDVPVEVLLVLDATTGQNAIIQAQAFKQAADLTGLILTKLDGTAKGGVAVAIKGELGLPIRFVGVGEQINDMRPFDADDFARALLTDE